MWATDNFSAIDPEHLREFAWLADRLTAPRYADAPVWMFFGDCATGAIHASNVAASARPATFADAFAELGIDEHEAERLLRDERPTEVSAIGRDGVVRRVAITRPADPRSRACVLSAVPESADIAVEPRQQDEATTDSGTDMSVVTALLDDAWRVRSTCPGFDMLLGRSPVGQRIDELVHHADLRALTFALLEAEAGRPTRATVRVRNAADGGWRSVLCSPVPLYSGTESCGIAVNFVCSSTVEMTALVRRLDDLVQHLESVAAARPARDRGSVVARDWPPARMLTPREREILELLARGARTQQVARQLFIAPSTVRNHLSSMFAKLGVSSQAELLEQLMEFDG